MLSFTVINLYEHYSLGDNYIIVGLENIVISDFDESNCLILNQLEGDLGRK